MDLEVLDFIPGPGNKWFSKKAAADWFFRRLLLRITGPALGQKERLNGLCED